MTSPIAGEREAMLPCPFCGCADIFIEPDERGSGGQWVAPIHVGCMACKCEQCEDEEAEAIAAWNRRAALLEPVEEGWVMVPKEPTEAMLDAACDVADVEFYGRKNVHEDIRREWAAMLNAASPKSNGGMGS